MNDEHDQASVKDEHATIGLALSGGGHRATHADDTFEPKKMHPPLINEINLFFNDRIRAVVIKTLRFISAYIPWVLTANGTDI